MSKNITTSKNNRRSRVSWCWSKLAWTVEENWSKVIFSDEMKVCFWQEQETARLEKTGEQLQPACLGIHTSAYRACFGAVYRTMVLELIPKFRGKLIPRSICFCVLDNNLWPIVAKEFNDSPWMLQKETVPYISLDRLLHGKTKKYTYTYLAKSITWYKHYWKCLANN